MSTLSYSKQEKSSFLGAPNCQSIRVLLLSFFLIAVLFSCDIAAAQNKPDYWPTINWQVSTPEEQGIDPQPLIEMLETIITDGVDIDSITIIRNGYLAADIYMYPSTKDKTHPIFSCTKSVTSTLIGIALDKGIIESTDQRMIDFFPERSINNLDERKRAITLKNLLTMSSGMETRDNVKDYGWQGVYEMRASSDWTQFVLDRPMAEPPGTRFEYSNLVSFLLTSILQKQAGIDALNFANTYLFGPLGIKDVLWYKSPKGIYTGYAELWLSPHDMAKLGFLYLQKGVWENQQILSQNWIENATKAHISVNSDLRYGYQWWVVENLYFAMGYQGQFIFVIPSKNMVVVFTSNIMGQSLFTPYKYLKKYILPAAKSEEALPVNLKTSERLEILKKDLQDKYYHNISVSQ